VFGPIEIWPNTNSGPIAYCYTTASANFSGGGGDGGGLVAPVFFCEEYAANNGLRWYFMNLDPAYSKQTSVYHCCQVADFSATLLESSGIFSLGAEENLDQKVAEK